MSVSDLVFEPVSKANEKAALDILIDAINWMEENDGSLWQREEINGTDLTNTADQSHYRLVCLNHTPAATFQLGQVDTRYWPDADDDAIYLHRIAIARAFRGQGLLPQIFRFAQNYAADMGRSKIRLDCDSNRGKLRSLYENAGFFFHSYISLDIYNGARYELNVVTNEHQSAKPARWV